VSFTMRTLDSRGAESPATGFTFFDWSSSMSAVPVRDLVLRAFAGAPDVIPMSVEDLRERLDSASPKPRLLFDGAELVGLCRTTAPAADGVGRIPMIARDPSRRGARLGDVLLVEAKRVLAAAGATRFELEVATQNRSALDLYERHGFEVVSKETTWSCDLGRERP
jgi:ribosomal protein S18 acetylase RimI-like enzyme